MEPDDPRHGQRKGALAHYKAGEKPCPACADAAHRWEKRARHERLHGEYRRTTLGQEAWEWLANSTAMREDLAVALEMYPTTVLKLIRRGPGTRLNQSTKDRIVAAMGRQFPTPIGIQRRLRALAALGWSMKIVAAKSGVSSTSLCNMRNKEELHYVKRALVQPIVDVYDELCMVAPPAKDRSVWTTKSKALKRGWVPPLAWDNIDDQNESPQMDRSSVQFDEVAVLRRMAGDMTVTLHRGESEEVFRRLAEQGYTPTWIERQTGLHQGRYKRAYAEGRAVFTRGEVA